MKQQLLEKEIEDLKRIVADKAEKLCDAFDMIEGLEDTVDKYRMSNASLRERVAELENEVDLLQEPDEEMEKLLEQYSQYDQMMKAEDK